MRLPIIVSAILPLIVAPESHGWVGAVIGITTWLVFLSTTSCTSAISSTTGAPDSAVSTCSW